MYVDGTSALQMLDSVFEVIEGGGEVPAGNVVEFVADNGAKIADVTVHEVNAANGAAAEVGEVVDIASGATSGTATGAGILTMEVGAVGAAIAPALGILAGVGLYKLTPEFWTNVSNALVDAGKTVGGKVVGFISKDGTTGFDEETIEIFKNAFINANVYEPTVDYPEFESVGNKTYTITSIGAGGLSTYQTALSKYISHWGSDNVEFRPYYNSTIVPALSTWLGTRSGHAIGVKIEYYDYYITESGWSSGSGIEVIDFGEVNDTFTLDEYKRGYFDVFLISTSGSIEHGVEIGSSYTTHDNWLTYAWIGEHIGQIELNPSDLWTNMYINGVNATATRENVQEGAILPTEDDPFPLTYPTWTPYEFPEPLPAMMPDVYPLSMPTPGITQDPAQEGANETAPQQDALVNTLFDNAPTISPDIVPDLDPYAPPAWEPTPPQPNPAPNPVDPNPSPTPSGTTISLPTLDTTSASKMFTVYNPTDAQVDALGGFLWNSSIIEQIKKMWQNPLDGIISFHKIYGAPTTGSSKNIILGYIDSGVSALEVMSQFVDVDCGTVTIPERLHNATDYAPFTSLHCYLPFIGIVELDTDECMNATLHIKYRIDVYTGTCVALLYLQRTVDIPNEQIIYTFSGNASQKLPLTASDFTGAVGALLGLVGAGVAVASGGSMGVAAGALGAAHSLTSEMVHIQHSGGLSANAGILSPRIPYIILSRQYGYDANGYNQFYGYPANKTVSIGNCSGFIKCKEVIFKGSCTASEMEEIDRLLKEGVYV